MFLGVEAEAERGEIRKDWRKVDVRGTAERETRLPVRISKYGKLAHVKQ